MMRKADLFNFLLEANLMACMAIVLLIIARKIFRKPLGSGPICFGWLLVAARLLCPLALPNPLIGSIRSDFINDLAIRPIATQFKRRAEDALADLYSFTRMDLGIPEEHVVSRGVFRAYSSTWDGSMAKMLVIIWLVGFALVLGWFIYSNLRFHRNLSRNRIEPLSGELLEKYRALCEKRKVRPLPVFLVDPLPSACLIGVFRPWIALPVTAEPGEAENILDHEICHFKGGDHLFALLRLFCCALHWFNPLVWLGANLCRADMEMRCDERVTRGMDDAQKRDYAAVLVKAAARRTLPGLPVLATGMTMKAKRLKSRVKGIIENQRPIRAAAFAFVLVSSMLLVGAFATAEYYPIPSIPDFSADMLVENRPVETAEEALALAREIAALPLIATDVDGAAWEVDEYPDAGAPAWRVKAVAPNINYYIVVLLKEGGIYSIAQSPNCNWDAVNQFPKYSHRDEEFKPVLLEFVKDFSVYANPALEGKLDGMKFTYDFMYQNRRYAVFETPISGTLQHMMLRLQTSPEIRILEYGPGNG